ncbi:hypothetical protein [Nocardiopsis coralliicola]
MKNFLTHTLTRLGRDPVAHLQIEYSLFSRAVEDGGLLALRESGVGMTAYSVLSRGMLSRHWTAESGGPRAIRCGTVKASGAADAATTDHRPPPQFLGGDGARSANASRTKPAGPALSLYGT